MAMPTEQPASDVATDTVQLWIEQDADAYRYWRERAQELAVTELAQELYAALRGEYPLQERSVYTDLLDQVLRQVNYRAIARRLKHAGVQTN